MNVTGQNITDIISYLYEKRLGKQAEPDVLESWSNLSDEEARLHLRQLFASWGLDEPQMQGILKEYERDLMFKQAEVAPSEASIDTPDDSSISYTPQVESGSIFTEAPTTAAKPKKGGYKFAWFLLLVFVAAIAYVLFQYQQFKQLPFVYVTTDNVSIRNYKGKIIGRMDIFAGDHSVSFLRTTGKKRYPITVGDKVYQCRQVLLDTTKFADYLFRKKESFGYVNENYLIENEKQFIIFRNAFKAINNVKHENNVLTAPYRKVVVGSLNFASELQDLFIVNACDNKNKNFTSIVRHQARNNVYQVVAMLSDGNYYIFSGNPDTQEYAAPQPFLYQNAIDYSLRPFNKENILFKKQNGRYYLYSCNGIPLEYYAATDENDMITFAKYAQVY